MAAGVKFPVELILKAVEGWSGPLGRVAGQLKTFNERLELATKGTRDFSKQWAKLAQMSGAKAIGAGVNRIGMAASNVAGELRSLAFWTGGAIVGTTFLINRLTDEGDALAKLAERTGLHVQALAEYQFVAQRAGMEIGTFNNSLEFFNKNLGLARIRAGAMYGMMKQHAPTLLAQLRATKDTDKALMLVFNAMAKLKDPQKRAALGALAFGKAGKQMANMVASGTKEIAELRREFTRIMGDQTEFARLSEQWNDIWGDFTIAMVGVGRAILTAVLPALRDMVENLKEFVIAHREEIGAAAKVFAIKLPKYINDLANAYNAVYSAIMFVASLFPSQKAFLTFLVGLKLLPLITAVWNLGRAFFAFAVILTTTPFGIVILAIAAIVLGIGLLIAFLYETSDIWMPYWKAFAGWVGWAIDGVIDGVSTLGQRLGDALGAALTYAFDFAKAFIPQWFVDLMQGSFALGQQIGNGVVDMLGFGGDPAAGASPLASPATQGGKFVRGGADINVRFDNVPRGTRMAAAGDRFTPVNLSMGYSLADGLN